MKPWKRFKPTNAMQTPANAEMKTATDRECESNLSKALIIQTFDAIPLDHTAF